MTNKPLLTSKSLLLMIQKLRSSAIYTYICTHIYIQNLYTYMYTLHIHTYIHTPQLYIYIFFLFFPDRK